MNLNIDVEIGCLHLHVHLDGLTENSKKLFIRISNSEFAIKLMHGRKSNHIALPHNNII